MMKSADSHSHPGLWMVLASIVYWWNNCSRPGPSQSKACTQASSSTAQAACRGNLSTESDLVFIVSLPRLRKWPWQKSNPRPASFQLSLALPCIALHQLQFIHICHCEPQISLPIFSIGILENPSLPSFFFPIPWLEMNSVTLLEKEGLVVL